MTGTYVSPSAAAPKTRGGAPGVAIGRDQFAYLRACLSGVPRGEAARRYLGLEPGPGTRLLHRQLVDRLQALARQHGDRRWPLLASAPRRSPARGDQGGDVMPSRAPFPSFEEWVAHNGWEDWSQAEQLEAYREACAAEQAAPAHDEKAGASLPASRRPRIDFLSRAEQRWHRLQRQQLALLQDLERLAGQPAPVARAEDPVATWFEPLLARRLHAAGLSTLGLLQRAVRHSARWHDRVKAVGEGKARRIEALLASWLPAGGKLHSADAPAVLLASASRSHPGVDRPAEGDPPGRIAGPTSCGEATPQVDRDAIQAWLAAVARQVSAATLKAYRREVERWWLWCMVERGRSITTCDADDGRAYLAFLAAVPERWQSRRPVDRWAAGWAPFRGSLAPRSRQFAAKVLHRCCEWLVDEAGYLDHNPWAAVERWRPKGQEPVLPPQARVLPAAAQAALQAALPDPGCPGATRNGLLLTLCGLTGLRASEILAAHTGRLQKTVQGWELEVRPMSGPVVPGDPRWRHVLLPATAVAAIEQSLAARGLPRLGACASDVPLLAADDDALRAPSYVALHRSFRALVMRAARRPAAHPGAAPVRAALEQATQQWLRHTFALRAAQACMPMEQLRHQLGHADTRRLRRYYRAARAAHPAGSAASDG